MILAIDGTNDNGDNSDDLLLAGEPLCSLPPPPYAESDADCDSNSGGITLEGTPFASPSRIPLIPKQSSSKAPDRARQSEKKVSVKCQLNLSYSRVCYEKLSPTSLKYNLLGAYASFSALVKDSINSGMCMATPRVRKPDMYPSIWLNYILE